MRILFISFYNKIDVEIHPGVGVLSNVLKKEGCQTRLYPYFYFDRENLANEIYSYKPNIIAISATSMSEVQVKKLVPYIKSICDADILLGGIYPILEPDKALSIEGVDAICVGEGSRGFVEYVRGNHPATNYIYSDGRRGEKECWKSVALDNIDYDLFWDCSRRLGIEISNKLDYWTSYTCEYACAFCSSSGIRKITGLKNKPRPEVEDCIAEIKELTGKNYYKKIHFRDPLFIGVADYSWVKEFLLNYRDVIGLPYTCNIRADRFSEEIAILLKETGCSLIKMGLESGDEGMRNKVLHKGETDRQFEEAISLMKKHGLRLSLNAMLGIPYETVETARKTMDMIRSLKPEKSFLHIYQPWPGLNLPKDIVETIRIIQAPAIDDVVSRGHAIDNGKEYMSIDYTLVGEEYINTPVLDQPNFSYKTALKLQQEFIDGGVK